MQKRNPSSSFLHIYGNDPSFLEYYITTLLQIQENKTSFKSYFMRQVHSQILTASIFSKIALIFKSKKHEFCKVSWIEEKSYLWYTIK